MTPVSAAGGARVERVPLMVALPFRRGILRPGRPTMDPAPGDLDAACAHFAVLLDGVLVAVASIDPQDCPAAPRHWQLRGVATTEAHRGRGHGRAAVEAAVAHARLAGARGVWCHGRTGASSFYAALGFSTVGEAYERPESGPHSLQVLTFAASAPGREA